MTTIGHNNPPDPIDEATKPFEDAIAEAETWLDGTEVENEGQMRAVDDLLKDIKAAANAVKAAEESEAKPLYDKWKSVKERYKPTLADLDKLKKGLLAVVNGYKKRLAEEKRKAQHEAWLKVEKARIEAERAAQEAKATDIEAQREAEALKRASMEAERAAQAAKHDIPKGLRKVTRHEITDMRALVNWIACNDKEAMAAFAEDWARKNRASLRNQPESGVRVWGEEEAF